jgi:uncharacterized protein (TIGR03083 family)
VIVDGYLAAAGLAAGLLRDPAVGHHWTEPSALPEYRISGLAGHLGMALFRALDVLDTPLPDDVAPVDAARYFAYTAPGQPVDDPIQQRIRSLGEEVAGAGRADLVRRVDATLDTLRTTLPTLPPDRLVCFRGRVLRYDQWLVTRLVELAVHMDDLAVSLDIETPPLPPEAADLVLTTLVRIAAAHHGAVPVMRSLSRRERAVVISAF